MAERPKNVLLLWTDQQRADTVGPDKDPRLRMPHLERLAATGTRSSGRPTAPSRCAVPPALRCSPGSIPTRMA